MGGSLTTSFFLVFVLWIVNFLGTRYFKSSESIFCFFIYYLIKLTNISSCKS